MFKTRAQYTDSKIGGFIADQQRLYAGPVARELAPVGSRSGPKI
ncbi:FAD dependent oxidoreductase [Pseudomonas mandelii JR-1]|uniref:FAD dependent oxidoreductase n=1 Tax=Pseudomonas mandelii JR-1 TaxID=1147786 RepID=A0A024EBS8_9PSED|nr:FAD dependent oxidoreductase [Pseudomonas mandelii JR-1]